MKRNLPKPLRKARLRPGLDIDIFRNLAIALNSEASFEDFSREVSSLLRHFIYQAVQSIRDLDNEHADRARVRLIHTLQLTIRYSNEAPNHRQGDQTKEEHHLWERISDGQANLEEMMRRLVDESDLRIAPEEETGGDS